MAMIASTSMASVGEEVNNAVGGEDTAVNSVTREPDRPQLAARRQSSFSDAFSKITTNPFNRRRTNTWLQSSTSSAALNHSSRIPTPSGIPRSSSYFSTLSAFASKASSTNDGTEDAEQLATIKPSRKVSDRLAQTPFFNYHHQRLDTTPFCNKQKRDSGVQIEQRGLMAPLHPPLPRSSTMGNLGQGQSAQNSPNTPSFMRSTSSSAARRTSLSTPKQRNTPLPSIPSSKTPRSASRIPAPGLGGSSKAAMGRRPTPSTGIISSSVTPTYERPRPSFGRGPSTSFVDHSATNCSKSKTPGTRGRTPPISYPSGRTSGLPSPKERRMGWCQGKKTGRRLTYSLRPSHYGDDGTTELMALDMDDPAVNGMLSSEAAKASDPNNTHNDTSVSASNGGDIDTNVPIHSADDQFEDAQESVIPAIVAEDEVAVTPEPAEPPFFLRDMSNPRLASLTPLSLPRSPITNLFDPLQPPESNCPSQIHTALHPLEWTGRFTALSDRFRTSALPSSPSRSPNLNSNSSGSSDTLTDSLHEPMHDEVQRNRRIWIHLQSLCTTDEAKESLAAFKVFMEEREKKMAGGVRGAKIKEKQGFFQALMGKKK